MGLAAELTQHNTGLVSLKKYQSKGQCMWGIKNKERQPPKNKNQKEKKNPEMSKKELRDIVKKFSVCVIGKGFQGGTGGEGPACQCRSCRRLRFNP